MSYGYKQHKKAIEKDYKETGIYGENALDDRIVIAQDGKLTREHSEPLLRHYEKRALALEGVQRKSQDHKGADYRITLLDHDSAVFHEELEVKTDQIGLRSRNAVVELILDNRTKKPGWIWKQDVDEFALVYLHEKEAREIIFVDGEALRNLTQDALAVGALEQKTVRDKHYVGEEIESTIGLIPFDLQKKEISKDKWHHLKLNSEGDWVDADH